MECVDGVNKSFHSRVKDLLVEDDASLAAELLAFFEVGRRQIRPLGKEEDGVRVRMQRRR